MVKSNKNICLEELVLKNDKLKEEIKEMENKVINIQKNIGDLNARLDKSKTIGSKKENTNINKKQLEVTKYLLAIENAIIVKQIFELKVNIQIEECNLKIKNNDYEIEEIILTKNYNEKQINLYVLTEFKKQQEKRRKQIEQQCSKKIKTLNQLKGIKLSELRKKQMGIYNCEKSLKLYNK